MITGDEESFADAELKRGGGAEGNFPNFPWVGILKLPKGKDFWGVNLKNWRMAVSLDESVGKVGGNREEAPAFQNVHRGDQVGSGCFISWRNLNWPQAASMSCPFSRRIVARTPALRRVRQKRWIASSEGRS